MSVEKILYLALLALLVLGCFLSENLAGLFVHEDETKRQKVSLLIKLAALIIAVITFFVIFIAA